MTDPLERYYGILNGKERARYILPQATSSDFRPEQKENDLWNTHEREIREMWARSRSGQEKTGVSGMEVRSLLDLKSELAHRMLGHCDICEWKCGVDRTSGRKGRCGVLDARISSEFLHYGEEPPLIPSHTIFFSGCNLRCAFCQNYDISTNPSGGSHIPPKRLAEIITRRFDVMAGSAAQALSASDRARAANVNWVGGDPTPNLAYIIDVLRHLRTNIPQIWNSNMYMAEKSMDLLDGIVDVYLTDFKYGNDICAERLSGVTEYMRIVTRNHERAAKDSELIVRHLVLPSHVDCCSIPVLDWLVEHLPNALVNVMDQYRPTHRAFEHDDVCRDLKREEYLEVRNHAEDLGLHLVD